MQSSDSSRDVLLERLAEEFVERHRGGECPPLSEFIARHPDLADDIRDLFPALVQLEQLKPVAGELTADAPPPNPPRLERLGEYRILREVGRGGMGIVYEAEQESLGRHVALKVLPSHALLSGNYLERFRREARAAAKLHHTNIVPVFGVGEIDGVHFYAMQFIRGEPLDKVIADVRQLRKGEVLPADGNVASSLFTGVFAPGSSVEAASSDSSATLCAPSALSSELSLSEYHRSVARVGVQVAEALAHAHKQGILHRDIKPSNLLLDPQGRVWITDFGLAKAEGSDELTQAGDIVGTLRFMAPERFEGQSLPQSDIYALGLTLYELLTLTPVFSDKVKARLIEKIHTEHPKSPRSIAPSVPRDLETVVLKCLAKDPRDRYATPESLAEDLERFLADRPINARRSSPRERAWRWCKRNPVVAGLLALVFGVLLAGITSTSLALQQAWRNEVEAKQNLATANQNLAKAEANEEGTFRAVDTHFRKISEERLLGEPGLLELRRDLLLASLPFYEEFAANHQGDPRWARQLADATFRLGQVHYYLNDLARARGYYQEALPMYRRLLENEPNSEELRRIEASCLKNAGTCSIGEQRFDEAERYVLAAQALYARLPDTGMLSAQISHQLALIAESRDRLPAAMMHADDAVKQCLRCRPKDAFAEQEQVYTLGLARGTRGALLSRMGRADDALAELAAAMQVYEVQLGKRPRGAQVLRTDLAKIQAVAGTVHLGQSRLKEAIDAFEAADAEFSRVMREFPTVAAHSRDWSANMHNLVFATRLKGDLGKAEAMQAKVVPVREQLHRDFPDVAQYAIDLSDSYREASFLARAKGKPEDAPACNARCVAVLRGCLARHPDSRLAKSRLTAVAGGNAQTLTQLGRHAESLEYWDLCLEHGGAPNPALIRCYRASARAIVGDWRRAEQDAASVGVGDKTEPGLVFALGCARAAIAEAAGKDESLATNKREEKRTEGTKEALTLLKEARRRGHPKSPFEVEQWKGERALSSLRKLPEFEAMLPR